MLCVVRVPLSLSLLFAYEFLLLALLFLCLSLILPPSYSQPPREYRSSSLCLSSPPSSRFGACISHRAREESNRGYQTLIKLSAAAAPADLCASPVFSFSSSPTVVSTLYRLLTFIRIPLANVCTTRGPLRCPVSERGSSSTIPSRG